MSEDESPTGGQQQPNAEIDQNSSLIEKVRTRVTSIIPQTLTKWFSPTTTGEDGNRNGSLRRRHEDMLDGDVDEDEHLEGNESDDDEQLRSRIPPPSKKSKLNVRQDYSPSGSYQNVHSRITSNMLSSTPTAYNQITTSRFNTARARHELNAFAEASGSNLDSRSISELRSITDYDAPDSDVLAVIPEHRDLNYECSRNSRRSLNIPTSSSLRRLPYLRRQTLKSQHAIPIGQNETDEEIVTNGIRASPNILQAVDTASESGESQSSSIQQRPKVLPGLFGSGAKRLRTSMGSGLNYATHLQGKKSLFCDKSMPNALNNSTSLTSLNRRQSFNASLYGSTSALSDSRLLNTSSPFYKGSTTYGGASAYSKYEHQILRALRTPTLIRPSSSLSTLSSSTNSLAQGTDPSPAISNTAKRILELMNQFTTPLADCKKMANNTKVPTLTAHRQRFNDLDRAANRGIRMLTPKTPYSRPQLNNTIPLAPPINELQVPSMSQLLQMKKLQNNTEKVRNITNQSKSILNREEEYKLPTENQNVDNKHVNKIKNKLNSTRSSTKSNFINDQETVKAATLPDIPLPLMASVPKIDIDISQPMSTAVSSKTIQSSAKISTTPLVPMKSATTSQSNDLKSFNTISGKTPTFSSNVNHSSKTQSLKRFASVSKPRDTTAVHGNSTEFKFSSPIEVATLAKSHVEPIKTFKFSDPVPVRSIPSSTENFTFQFSNSNTKPKPISTSSNNTLGNPSVFPNVAAQLKTSGSVLEAFKKPFVIEKSEGSTTTTISNPSTPAFGGQFKMSSSQWECSVCMIRNDNTKDRCVACETARKKPENSVQSVKKDEPKMIIKSSFGDKFKPSSDTWECSTCMIRNKSDVNECVACNTLKAGTKPVTVAAPIVPKTTDAGFKNIVAQQSSNKWECSACMTRNESTRMKCVCCEQAKPGAVSENVPQFSFGSSASKFTFGFANKKEDELKSVAATDNKTTTTSTSLLLDKSKAENKTGFTFGIKPAVVANATTSTPPVTFGFTSTSTPTVESKAATTTSTFKFGVPAQEKKPVESKSSETKTESTIKPSALSQPATKDKSAETSALSTSTTTSPIYTYTNANPVGGFAFGNQAKKSEAEVFGFGTSKLTSGSNTTSSPSTGGFSLAGSSLLQKAETSVTPASDSNKLFAIPTAPVNKTTEKAPGFSFGSSSGTSAFSSPVAQKTEAESSGVSFATPTATAATVTKSEVKPNTMSFVFGKSSTPASVTPTFGAVSSNAITSSTNSNVVATVPSFGSLTSKVSSTSTPSFGAPSTVGSAVATPSFGSIAPQPQSLKFGSSFSASTSSSPQQQQDNKSSNLFTFGGGNKTETAAPIFGNVSSTTTKPFTFGSSSTNVPASTVTVTTASSTPFLFGGGTATATATTQKPIESASLFGSTNTNTTNNTIGTAALPAFGSFSATPLTNQQSASQQTTTTFGQSSSLTNPFGGPAAGATNSTSTFGSAATAVPNAGTAPLFGSGATIAPFGSGASGFGAANNSTFGSSSATPAFGNGFGTTTQQTDDTAANKPQVQGFNFNATPQETTAATGGFSFGANNNNNNKQPFSFSATPAPAFNFTGNQEATNTSPFQFGAAPITPAVFNFSGVETATNAPFQFSAAPAANNIFAVTPGAPQTSQRRKARAVRRTQQR